MSELTTGTLLQGGKYRIEKLLGQGGFGITYLAEQTLMERKVCIKEFFMKEYGGRTTTSAANDAATVIADEATVLTGVRAITSDAAEIMGRYRDKFIKEAKTISRLDHPGIVRIHDVFEENGTAYYVMDYIEGENLNDKVKQEGALPEERALGYIRQVADALSYVHSQKIMHLDVKPANIIVRKSDDRAILIDFGTAKQYDSEGTQTSTTPIGLSAGYAPIELMKVGGVKTYSPETDVYSLGATLYYLVTGKNPPDASERMEMIMEGEKFDLPESISTVTAEAIEQALQSRKKRPQTVADFLGLLPAEKWSVASAKDHSAFCKNCGEILIPNAKFCPNCGAAVVLQETSLEHTKPQNKPKKVVKKLDACIENGHKWVDLGLSVKWATCNIGATKPENYGSYFAWGETSPKDSYHSYNYFHNKIKFSRYEEKEIIIKYNSIDSKTRLDSIDDAACVNWGGKWRMPTDAEMTELREKCKWEWTTQGGRNGYKVTSKTNGNSIFLPAAGDRDGSNLDNAGFKGDYWSSSLHTDNPKFAWRMYFHSDEVYRSRGYRYRGFSVRPVTE